MLMPKRVKYRRVHRGRLTGKAYRGNKLSNGSFGLVALEPSWITSKQIEAARIAMTRYIKRGGQVWIKIFPDKPVPMGQCPDVEIPIEPVRVKPAQKEIDKFPVAIGTL